MSTTLIKYYREFEVKKDIVSFIKFFSVSTWQKIGFVRSKDKLKMHETTITQNLLFLFQLLADQYPQAVQMFETTDELARGNDIEIFIKMSRGYVAFPCQAKISYKQANKKGKPYKPEPYTAINHPVEVLKGVKQQQIKTLIDYADWIGGVPIYLFYNYCSDKSTTEYIKRLTGIDVELYGCSYVNAKLLSNAYLKGMKWKPIPNFTLIHPTMALPFFRLFESIGEKRLVDPGLRNTTIGKADANEVLSQLRQYSLDELVANDNWIKTAPLAETNVFPSQDQSLIDQVKDDAFNPSFRIVFTNEGFQGFSSQFLMML